MTSERTSGPADAVSADPDPDTTDPAAARPPGAVDARFTLAAERTMLAWVRTALGFLAAGIAVVYLSPDADTPALGIAVGVLMVVLGCALVLIGAWRWRRTTRALVDGGEMPGPGGVIFIVTAIVVVAVLVAIVMVVQS
ncbi:DUF202 domain-containing protein [Gordonia jinghuaiqii]|uniref:DUF202 domain-containing protein n=1 Tax=Gordonia jinghuaiqii TaxID=2758710 RepID=A0A7D7LWA4_9ACTN|nr:DUF202 domain-containing protein [Gordonia jinghuaiqii]QMT04057.1 DUF202 domain-containing protein [Gordonia jinghuaiqii]